MKSVWLKLKHLKPAFKQLNSMEFKEVAKKISKARVTLKEFQQEMQNNYSDSLADQEKVCLQQLEKWSLIEESAMQQKSRVTRIKLGDSNTKYFKIVMKEKQHQKQILEITSLVGMKLQYLKAIKIEFDKFL